MSCCTHCFYSPPIDGWRRLLGSKRCQITRIPKWVRKGRECACQGLQFMPGEEKKHTLVHSERKAHSPYRFAQHIWSSGNVERHGKLFSRCQLLRDERKVPLPVLSVHLEQVGCRTSGLGNPDRTLDCYTMRAAQSWYLQLLMVEHFPPLRLK